MKTMKMMMSKVAMLLAVVLVMSAMMVPGAMACQEYLGELRVVNCNEWVTLRASPSTSAATVTRVPLGSIVEGWSCDNYNFVECYYNGMWGYILREYLAYNYSYDYSCGYGSYTSYDCSGYSYGDYMGYMIVSNCKEWVTLRAYADTSAPALARVPLGVMVESYYYNSDFSQCYYNGMWGYILSDYLI